MEIRKVPDDGDVIDELKTVGSHVHEPKADFDINVCFVYRRVDRPKKI